MASAAQIPNAAQPIIEKAPNGNPTFTRPWVLFFQALLNLVDGSDDAPEAVTVGVSPFTYEAPEDGLVLVSGGTVSLIEYGRGGVFTNIGVTAGAIRVNAGDSLRITYTVAPTVTLVRQ